MGCCSLESQRHCPVRPHNANRSLQYFGLGSTTESRDIAHRFVAQLPLIRTDSSPSLCLETRALAVMEVLELDLLQTAIAPAIFPVTYSFPKHFSLGAKAKRQ